MFVFPVHTITDIEIYSYINITLLYMYKYIYTVRQLCRFLLPRSHINFLWIFFQQFYCSFHIRSSKQVTKEKNRVSNAEHIIIFFCPVSTSLFMCIDFISLHINSMSIRWLRYITCICMYIYIENIHIYNMERIPKIKLACLVAIKYQYTPNTFKCMHTRTPICIQIHI